MDLQYLPDDKEREEDPDIRKMLLESLFMVPQAHTSTQQTVMTLVFPRRSSLCVSGAADGYRVWTTDVEGKECLSNHERVPPMGERRACRSILREANPGSTQIKANLSVAASCKFHFLHCMVYRLRVFCELCSSIFLVFYLLFDVFFIDKRKILGSV